MYCDDYYPLEIANKIVHSDFSNLNDMFVANGLLFVPAFLIFGVHYQAGIYTIIFLSILSLLCFFYFSILLTKNYWAALLATTLMAFNYSYVQYSISTYNHIPTFFFIMLTLFAFLLYLRLNYKYLLYLSLSSLLYLILIRIEMFFLVPFLLFLYVKHTWARLKNFKTWVPWLIFLGVFSLGFLKNILFFSNLDSHPFIKMSFDNFYENISGHFIELLGLNYYLILLIIIGFFFIIIRKNWILLFIFSSSLFYLVFYLFLNFAHISGGRLLHYSVSVLYIIIAFGIASLIKLIRKNKLQSLVYILIFIYLIGFFLIENVKTGNDLKESEMINKLYFDTRFPTFLQKIIPNNCVILSPHPVKFTSVTNLKSIYLEVFNQKVTSDKCFILVEDISCTYPEWEVKGMCERFKEKYDLAVYGYVDSTMIEVPLKTLTLNYTMYKVLSSS
ncbi:MAG: hypothetical protein ACFFG0_38375 [Candidatus Thorarchaeota archaeon]